LVLGGLSVVVVLEERRWGVEERQGEVERGGEREPVGGSYKGCRAVFIVVIVVVVVRMLSDIVVVDGRREEVERAGGGFIWRSLGFGFVGSNSLPVAFHCRLSPPFAPFATFKKYP
jgi:hypothetical protein